MFDIITINLNINSGIFLSAPESNNENRSLNELRNLEYQGKRIFSAIQTNWFTVLLCGLNQVDTKVLVEHWIRSLLKLELTSTMIIDYLWIWIMNCILRRYVVMHWMIIWDSVDTGEYLCELKYVHNYALVLLVSGSLRETDDTFLYGMRIEFSIIPPS